MSRRSWVSAVVVLLLAPVVAPRPAAAEQSLAWPGAPICAEGTLTAGPRSAADPARTPFAYSIHACAGTDPATLTASRWNIAIFATRNARASIPMRTVPAHGSPAMGEARGPRDNGLEFESTGRVQAACLNTGHIARVACVRIDAVGDAGTIVMTPIAVTDPLVDRFVTIPTWSSGGPYTNPECVGCL